MCIFVHYNGEVPIIMASMKGCLAISKALTMHIPFVAEILLLTMYPMTIMQLRGQKYMYEHRYLLHQCLG